VQWSDRTIAPSHRTIAPDHRTLALSHRRTAENSFHEKHYRTAIVSGRNPSRRIPAIQTAESIRVFTEESLDSWVIRNY